MISYSFHLSTGKHSLTTCRKVSGASKHNLRKYESEEYDRTQIAILRGGDTNILDDVKKIYHQEFDEVIAGYNAGKRKDRQIDDYIQYVSDNAKNDVAAEIIMQIGDKEFWADKTSEQKRACVELLGEQLTRLEELAPDFKIASAVVHLDESSPHIHLVGVPVASGYKRGPEKQAAKTKVFTQETLEMLQEQMHRFAQSQMEQHPEIFDDEELKEIEKGRNSDYSKEYYIRQKAEKMQALEEAIEEKKEEINSLEQVHEELQEDTQKVVEEYVKAKTDSSLKKDFLQFVTQEEPKSELAKLATKVWRTFRAWWDKNRRPEVEKTARESVLRKLQRHKHEAAEQSVKDKKVDRKKDQYR